MATLQHKVDRIRVGLNTMCFLIQPCLKPSFYDWRIFILQPLTAFESNFIRASVLNTSLFKGHAVLQKTGRFFYSLTHSLSQWFQPFTCMTMLQKTQWIRNYIKTVRLLRLRLLSRWGRRVSSLADQLVSQSVSHPAVPIQEFSVEQFFRDFNLAKSALYVLVVCMQLYVFNGWLAAWLKGEGRKRRLKKHFSSSLDVPKLLEFK